MNQPHVRIILFWVYGAIWTLLLLAPNPIRWLFLPEGMPEDIMSSSVPWDKIVHAVGYGLLIVLTFRAFGSPHRTRLGWLFAFGVAHASATELAQLAIPQRQGDWGDWFVDVAGVGVGLALTLFVIRRRRADRS